MLQQSAVEGTEDIISFHPNGRSFAIHKPHEFLSDIIPKYFTTTRMSSFQRQVRKCFPLVSSELTGESHGAHAVPQI
jgi:HSF-type DNA-binding